MKNENLTLNIKYSALQGSYWMFYGAIYSFASAFLLAKNISNSQIGIILALSNIIGIVLISLFSALADKNGTKGSIAIGQRLSILMLVLTVLLIKGNLSSFTVASLFVAIIAVHTCLQPVISDLAFKFSSDKINVSFGIARSMGSLAYSLLCIILGILVNKFGIITIPLSGSFVLFLMFICFSSFRINLQKNSPNNPSNLINGNFEEKDAINNSTKSKNMFVFLSENINFTILCFGVVGVFFSNGILNSFLLQIAKNLNGTEKDLGYLYAFMAALEIPTLLFFDKINKKFSYKFMLSLASICFTLKIALCTIAPNILFLYLATLLQPPGFALFLPAMVHYIENIMEKSDAVKGQGAFTMAVTVSSVLASISGGFLIDIFSVFAMNLTATIAGIAGTVTVISVTNKANKL